MFYMIHSPKDTMASTRCNTHRSISIQTMSIMDRADELIRIRNTETNSCNENEVLSQPFGLRSLSVFILFQEIDPTKPYTELLASLSVSSFQNQNLS